VPYDARVESLDTVEIAGARTLVRELEPRDIEALLELAGDPEVVRFVDWPARSRESLSAFVERSALARRASPRITYALAVDESATGDTVGFVRLAVTSVERELAELGGYLRRRHWRRGLAMEIGSVVRQLAFGELGLRRLACYCDTENVASIRVVEKLGFVCEATIRRRLQIDGVWRDSHVYELPSPRERDLAGGSLRT
jgi:ribosomal-protein-alanine N-acetyltransferase